MASVGIAMEAAEQAERNALQASLFDAGEEGEIHAPQYLQVKPWDDKEKLMREKEALGFFFSGHPYDSVRAELARFVRRSLNQLEPAKEVTLIAGVVAGIRTQMTRRGKMLLVQLDDGSAMVEVTVFNALFDAERDKIVTAEVLLIEGKIRHDEYSDSIRVTAEKLMTLGEARARFARHLQLNMNGQSDVARLKDILAPFPGVAAVRIHYKNAAAACELTLGASYRVNLEDALLRGLREWLKPENVEVVYG